MDRRYALQIDGLRLIAMVSIFCNHCAFLKLNPSTDYLFEHFLHFGGIGVEFFILLSGFMAAISYNPNQKAITYIKKRAIRLFPIHLICMLLFIPIILSAPSIERILSLFFTTGLLQSITPYTWNYYNPVSWTISTLWMLYLITPFIMQRIEKIRKGNAISILVLSIVVGFYFNYKFFDKAAWFFYISPFYRIVTFLQGILLAQIVKTIKIQFRSGLISTFLEVLVLAIFVAELVVVTKFSHCGYFYTLPISLVIIVFYVGGGGISILLSNKIIIFLSKLSFSFYMIHFWIVEGIIPRAIKYIHIETSQSNLLLLFFISLIMCFVIAYWLNKEIENKATHRLTKRFIK